MSPLAVYVHVPFCPSKCGYCDFNSFALDGDIVGRTVRATQGDILGGRADGRPASSVFFGGGTPTFLQPEDHIELLESVRAAHPFEPGCEVSTEANPGTVDREKLARLRSAGFNRISIGAQSFASHDLIRLGRVHGSEDIYRTVRDARAAGFENLNIDLMFGLPGQGIPAWRANLEQALALSPDHLSLYGLTIEPNTRFYRYWGRGWLDLPTEELQVEMYDLATELTSQAGLDQYEISNYARPGTECRHNLSYWRADEYAGYGPGAVGTLRVGEDSWPRVRTTKLKHPERYCEAAERGTSLVLDAETIDHVTGEFERVMLGIRLNEGLEAPGLNAQPVASMIERGWLEQQDGRVRLTPAGRHFCSEVALALT